MERELAERERFLQEKKRLAEMGMDLDEPQEALACPSCLERYPFGSTCPDCQVVLVGESSLALVKPERPLDQRKLPPWLENAFLLLAMAASLVVSAYMLSRFL